MLAAMRGADWVVATVALVSACVTPNAIECSNGRVCPGGTTCDVTHALCVTSAQASACDGLVDGDHCTFASQGGICDLGVCIVTTCGDGVVDEREVCDDGNVVSGDGCRADCAKTEMCGDAIVDANEPCDDGNANPADGCDACVATGWRASALIGGATAATSVGIAAPTGVAGDRAGNLYVV